MEKKTTKSYTLYTSLFNEAEKSVNGGKLLDKDLWLGENQFITQLNAETKEHIAMASFIVQIWYKVKAMEFERM
jgi:hypothetical protein